jgi:hypothetical protein
LSNHAHRKPEDEAPKRHRLSFRQLPGPYTIVRLAPAAPIPTWATKGDFTSITCSADELSIVCPAANLLQDINPRPRWICLKLEGPFPLSQTGVLLSFINPLSDNAVPIFAISTYDTDYVLVREEHMERVLDLLREAGHKLISDDDQASRKMIE